MSLAHYYPKSREEYNQLEFRDMVLDHLKNNPCYLCKENHVPKFYLFARRSYKDGMETKQIIVIRLLCEINAAKRKKGKNSKKQYTITILPSFLVPHSRILLDDIMKSSDTYITDSDTTQEKAASLLGVVNIRSFIRHFSRIIKNLPRWTDFLIKEITGMDGKIQSPGVKEIKSYTNQALCKWDIFNELKVQYIQVYLSLPDTKFIPENKYYQFIHSCFAYAGMGLGP